MGARVDWQSIDIDELSEKAANKPGQDKCPECGTWFEQVAVHWSLSDCERPNLSEHQKELLVGSLMGDGSIHFYENERNSGQTFTMKMVNEKFMRWFNEQFGIMSTDVREVDQSSNPWSDKTQYRVAVRRCDVVDKLAEWYESEEKVFPEDIELTPTILKMWYVGDGSISNGQIQLHMWNERKNRDKIERYFEKAGLPTPGSWTIDEENHSCSARWGCRDSNKLLDYMGEPPPGFEYKWQRRSVENSRRGVSLEGIDGKMSYNSFVDLTFWNV